MTEFECTRYALMVTRTDIFCWGILVGGLAVVLAKWFERFLEIKFSVDQKKLDLSLGAALLKMKTDLDDRILKFEKK